MHRLCLSQLVSQEVGGQKQVVDASRVTARKACKKRSTAIWAGSSVIRRFARFWYRDNCARSPYRKDCLACHAGYFLKPCNTFGAAVPQNKSNKILSGF